MKTTYCGKSQMSFEPQVVGPFFGLNFKDNDVHDRILRSTMI